MKMTPLIPRASALLLSVLADPVSTQDKAAFDADIDRVHALMKKGRWKPARSELDALLKEHERQGYVIQRGIEIQEDMKRCVFRSLHVALGPEDVVNGKLVRYESRTGRIKLVCRSGQLQDFESAKNGFLSHPLTFRGK